MDNLLSMLSILLTQLPVILVWLVGMILAIVNWQAHPKVSLLVVISLAGILITSIIGSYLNVWLPILLQQRGYSIQKIGIILSIRALAGSLLTAFFWGLLLVAIFGWRNNKEKSL